MGEAEDEEMMGLIRVVDAFELVVGDIEEGQVEGTIEACGGRAKAKLPNAMAKEFIERGLVPGEKDCPGLALELTVRIVRGMVCVFEVSHSWGLMALVNPARLMAAFLLDMGRPLEAQVFTSFAKIMEVGIGDPNAVDPGPDESPRELKRAYREWLGFQPGLASRIGAVFERVVDPDAPSVAPSPFRALVDMWDGKPLTNIEAPVEGIDPEHVRMGAVVAKSCVYEMRRLYSALRVSSLYTGVSREVAKIQDDYWPMLEADDVKWTWAC